MLDLERHSHPGVHLPDFVANVSFAMDGLERRGTRADAVPRAAAVVTPGGLQTVTDCAAAMAGDATRPSEALEESGVLAALRANMGVRDL